MATIPQIIILIVLVSLLFAIWSFGFFYLIKPAQKKVVPIITVQSTQIFSFYPLPEEYIMTNKLSLAISDIGTYAVSFQDTDKQPIPNSNISTPPVWAIDQPALATVTPSADGFSVTVDPVAAGTINLTATTDVDPGDGIQTVTATIPIDLFEEPSIAIITQVSVSQKPPVTPVAPPADAAAAATTAATSGIIS